ncbi:MAG: B12-binding domain-containing radical SAM protein [Candidatus Omnitrophota bacterium]|nr:MAG: B12-binding domain-containing radical SAM protein [Candidatus Omnitrophota bacterium]
MDTAIINSKEFTLSDNLSLIEYCKSLRSRYKPNKKVLLVQIPQFIFKSFNSEIAKRKGYYIFPPTGLQYLYESLKNRDLDIKILDLNFMLLKKVCEDEIFDDTQWLISLKNSLKSFKPFIMGVSCMYDSGIPSLMQILEFLKREGQSVIIAGGVIATYEWENLLSRKLCHFVVKGEGENKINYLFDHLTEENQNFAPIPGICYNYQDNDFATNGKQDKITLATDLIDSYSLIEIEKYHEYGSLNPFSRISGISDHPFAAIQMNRGCRGACTFCSVHDFIGSDIHKRPVDKVLDEMEFLINRRGVRHFEWLDDDLLFFKKDFQLLLKTIIKRKWRISWSANNGLIASSIDDEMMRLMRDSGCIGFKVGIETGNAEMLKKIKKPVTLDTFRRVSRIFKHYPEIFVGGNFMLGFPHERFCQMMDSFWFFLELDLDWGAFTICQAIRGATAFSDFEDHFSTQISLNDENIKNFIPTRESPKGQLSNKLGIFKSMDVFKINPETVPSEEQVKEIWFTFNLVGNFINNKNLKPEGKVEKFISWVEMAQIAYPTNAYMSLFLSLAYIIKGDQKNSRNYYNKAVLCHQSDYWRERFSSFGLTGVLNNLPRNAETAWKTMETLREYCSLHYRVG